MSFKLIAILKETLDVSWNPFEERNIKQYDELLNGYIRDVLMMAKDRSIYSKGLKKSEIPSEVYEQLRFEHDNHEGEVSGLDAIMENFSEDEVLERITKLLSQFNLKEALDISWNPYQEPANYTNKEYNFVDCDTSSKGPIVSMFFQDENENDLKIEVDTKTRSIIKAQDWGENGDENTLDAKVVKELNQNPYLKRDIDVISKFLFVHMEAIDVSWNPFEEVNYANKFYEFADYSYLDGGPTVQVLFKDEDDNDLQTIVDLKTGEILDASTWDGESEKDVDLDLKVVEQLNQNKHIKDTLRRWVYHINKNRFDETIDVSWNPFEDHDYTVSMGKLDKTHIIMRHYTAKDERSALVEFFMESLGQDSQYAEIAVNGTKEIKLKNSIGYGDKRGDFFWIVAKGSHDEDYMISLSKEYKQKYNI
jgi:hypothetical protein